MPSNVVRCGCDVVPCAAADSVELVSQLRAKGGEDRPVILFGVSMGGAIALNVSRKVPEMVATAVLLVPMIGIAPAQMIPEWQVWRAMS